MANISSFAANTAAIALAPLMNAGYLEIFSGSIPANANQGLAGNTLLVTLALGNPAFQNPIGGVLTANTIASGVAVATGNASFARIYQSNGNVTVMDVPIGAALPYEIVLNTLTIVGGSTISLTSFSVTLPLNGAST